MHVCLYECLHVCLYVFVGERAYLRNLPNSRGHNVTLVVAVSPVIGLVWSHVRMGSMNQYEFLQFLLKVFQVLSGNDDPNIRYACMSCVFVCMYVCM